MLSSHDAINLNEVISIKGLKFANVANFIALIVLQAVPFGLKVPSESQSGIVSKIFCSYFSDIPLRNGDVGPFICAILTIITLSLILLAFLIDNRALKITLCALPVLAFVGSVIPMFFDSYTVLGGIISAMLLIGTEINIYVFGQSDGKDDKKTKSKRR